jgi:hypothetical protein
MTGWKIPKWGTGESIRNIDRAVKY